MVRLGFASVAVAMVSTGFASARPALDLAAVSAAPAAPTIQPNVAEFRTDVAAAAASNVASAISVLPSAIADASNKAQQAGALARRTDEVDSQGRPVGEQ